MSGKHPRRRKRKKRASQRFPDGQTVTQATLPAWSEFRPDLPPVSISTIRARLQHLSQLRGSSNG